MINIDWTPFIRHGLRVPSNGVAIFLLCLVFTSFLVFHRLDVAGQLSVKMHPMKSLNHFTKSRDLRSYTDKIQTLIEPGSKSCQHLEETPVVVLVTSSPSRFQQRQAIRETYAKKIPTYFFLGLRRSSEEELIDNYVESKQYDDLIVFDFLDAYFNLTLKTALMIGWSARRCNHNDFVFKTDDDVMVNPWTLKEVVKEHAGDKLIGYRITGSTPHRNPYNKWHLPKWLYPDNVIPEYLSGTGYLISSSYLKQINKAAFEVSLINLEDIYITYLVANRKLGLQLTHDQRMSPFQPIFPIDCTYWNYASIHSLKPKAITNVWRKIEALGQKFEKGQTVCSIYNRYFSLFSSGTFLYR